MGNKKFGGFFAIYNIGSVSLHISNIHQLFSLLKKKLEVTQVSVSDQKLLYSGMYNVFSKDLILVGGKRLKQDIKS